MHACRHMAAAAVLIYMYKMFSIYESDKVLIIKVAQLMEHAVQYMS